MTRRNCSNPTTGRMDYGLGVQTGMMAPDFLLHTVTDPAVVVSLRSLLTKRPQQAAVLVQFGAYT